MDTASHLGTLRALALRVSSTLLDASRRNRARSSPSHTKRSWLALALLAAWRFKPRIAPMRRSVPTQRRPGPNLLHSVAQRRKRRPRLAIDVDDAPPLFVEGLVGVGAAAGGGAADVVGVGGTGGVFPPFVGPFEEGAAEG